MDKSVKLASWLALSFVFIAAIAFGWLVYADRQEAVSTFEQVDNSAPASPLRHHVECILADGATRSFESPNIRLAHGRYQLQYAFEGQAYFEQISVPTSNCFIYTREIKKD